MKYGPALDAADRAFICKEMTRELAAPQGLLDHLHGPADRPARRQRAAHQPLAHRRCSGGANAFDDPKAEHGLSTLARQCLGGLIAHHEGMAAMSAPLGQQLQAADPRHHRRLLGQLGSRQPHQHVPRPGRTRRGDAHREPHAVRQREPVPRRRRHAQRSAARCRRRSRLRCSADRRRRRRAEHRPSHAAHLAEALAAFEADTRAVRGDGRRPGEGAS